MTRMIYTFMYKYELQQYSLFRGQMSYYVIHVLGTVIVRCEVRLATGDGSGNSPSFLETDGMSYDYTITDDSVHSRTLPMMKIFRAR